MAKYHINKNGEVSACRARTRPCPLGGDNEHFDSKNEAMKFVEKKNKDKFGVLPGSKEKTKTTYGYTESEILKLKNLTDTLNNEIETKNYVLQPVQRNVVYTMTSGYLTHAKLMSNLEKTSKEGFFHTSFNDKEDAAYLLANLNRVLGTPEGTFYFERVALNGGNKTTVPGFSFMGMPVKGVITENRLFKKVD